MSIASTKPHLHRLDNTTWSYIPSHDDRIPTDEYKEIRLQVPTLDTGRERFELVSAIRTALETNRALLKRDLFRNGFQVQINDPTSPLNGKWVIQLHHSPCLIKRIIQSGLNRISQAIPFTKTFSKRKTVVVDVRRPETCRCPSLTRSVHRVATFIINQITRPSILETSFGMLASEKEELSRKSFYDPFTTLASRALKTIDPDFVMETAHQGGYRFILLESHALSLEAMSEGTDVQQQVEAENRTVVRAYKEFLIREFGMGFVEQIQNSYNIHFDEMIEKGLPLLPDHVSKCNIGTNDITMTHVENIWNTIKKIHASVNNPLASPPETTSASEYLITIGHELSIPTRVLRNIYRMIPHQTPESSVTDLQAFLKDFFPDDPVESVRKLPPAQFNAVVDMIMPSDDERKKSFTGRKIRHICIMGFNTMGNPNIPNRCRDLFELLHVFDDCRKQERWKSYYEILSHVVVKKSLFKTPPLHESSSNQLQVGLLIPAPDSNDNKRRWYITDALFDDSKGNLNYVLLPGCHGYRSSDNRTLPMIKLYRSTASNKNAMNWHDSIAADLNPHGSPGSLNPDLSLPYERTHFNERTIPIWMGHLIVSLSTNRSKDRTQPTDSVQQNALQSVSIESLKRAAIAFKEYLTTNHPEESFEPIQRLLETQAYSELEQALISYGHTFKEDPRYKLQQDIACVGHSLGGALAQAGTYLFSARLKRMPLPGHQFICYSSDGPAIDNAKDAEFMQFGHTNREMFRMLNVRWRVHHQFEYGDIVPQAGGSHLGTTSYNGYEDTDWLDEKASVFKPLDGAEALSIVNPPTHGRRTGTSVVEKDYTFTTITPKELSEYDHAFMLGGRIKKIWGYRFLNSPQLSEWLRRMTGKILSLPLKIVYAPLGDGAGNRDQNGVLAVRYGTQEGTTGMAQAAAM